MITCHDKHLLGASNVDGGGGFHRRIACGFTLIEMLIVMVVIAILAAISIPKFIDLRSEAENVAEEQIVKAVESGLTINDAVGQVKK